MSILDKFRARKRMAAVGAEFDPTPVSVEVDEAFKRLMSFHRRAVRDASGAVDTDWCAVPEEAIREFARKHNISETVALGRYGWWAENGHAWPRYADPSTAKHFKFRPGDSVVVRR